jgi:inositol transport system substrate-binding protein
LVKIKRGLVLTVILLLAASSVVGAAGKKTIGVLICDFSDQFQVYMMEGMKEAAAKYPDIEFVYQDAKYDANTQMNQMENLIVRRADAIVVMPVDAKASVPMVQQAVDAGIPVISVNRKLENQEVAVSYAGSDSVESGEILMQQMAKLLGGKGNIVILEGGMGHEPQILRQQGIMNILANYPDIKIVADQPADWYRDKGMAVMENWLQADLKIDAVVAHNDEMAIGALIAAEDAGVADKLLIAGIDATPEALEFVRAGKLAFTVFQDAKGQGRASIDTAVKVVRGETVPKEVMIPYELVTKDQADEYEARYK